jgi:hypothetical protein
MDQTSDAGTRGPVTFFVHVPKCAGTTVESYLTEAFPDRVLMPRRKRAPARYLSRYYEIAPFDSSRIDFVAGHYFGKSMTQFFPGRECRMAILLRDPINQLLSHYNYRMHRYLKDGLRPFAFALWYRSRPRNPITEHLLQRYLEISPLRLRMMSDEERYELAAETLSTFWYVGAHASCGDLIAKFAVEYGASADFDWLNSTGRYLVEWDQLEPKLKARIERDNAVDRRIFNRFCTPERQQPQIDGSGVLASLMKDAQRPTSVVGYRLLRSGLIPRFATSERLPPRGVWLRNVVAATLCTTIALAYFFWNSDVIPDGAPLGYFDDGLVATGLLFACSILMII